MKFALPILTADGREFADAKALDALLVTEKSGHYLLGNYKKCMEACISAMNARPGAGINTRCGLWRMARWWHFG